MDDGAHSDVNANDGEYAENFRHTYEAGTYHFVFRATGKSRDGQLVVREAMRDKVVLDKTTPPVGHGGDGSNDDQCCKDLLKAISHQMSFLEELIKRK